ncbi:MAG: hypothetical protein ACLRWQ_24315 [Flavonifractor plautii]
MLILNGVVHPMDGPVIPRGFVAFEGEKLTAVGPMEALPAPGRRAPHCWMRRGAYPARLHRRPLPPGAVRRRLSFEVGRTTTSPPDPVPLSSGP